MKREELIPGEIYVYLGMSDRIRIFQFGQIRDGKVYHRAACDSDGSSFYSDKHFTFDSFRSATQEEKNILLDKDPDIRSAWIKSRRPGEQQSIGSFPVFN